MNRDAYDEFRALSPAQQYSVLEQLDPISDRELHERFDSSLNECLETVKIGTLEYEPAETLRAVDPVAYRCEFSDWLGTNEDFVELCWPKTADMIPKAWPVQPDPAGDTLCGQCNLRWNDSVSTSLTPVPSGRCPFESFHSKGCNHYRIDEILEQIDRLQSSEDSE
jgi:hypothetical protein